MLWIGEVQDARSIDDLNTPTPFTGITTLERKIPSRNKLPLPKEKVNQRRDYLRADRMLGWSTTSSWKLVATMKPSWTSKDLTKVPFKNDNVQAFDTNWDLVFWQTYQQHIGESVQDASWKSRKNLKMCCKSTLKTRQLATRNTTIANWSSWPKDISSIKSKILISKREIETRTDLQQEFGAEEERNDKVKKMPANNSERGHGTLWITQGQCSFGGSWAFKHEPNKKGKWYGRPRSPSPIRSPHRNAKGDGKGSDDGGANGTPKLIGKSLVRKREQTTL